MNVKAQISKMSHLASEIYTLICHLNFGRRVPASPALPAYQ
jgi:hypothetical protein